MLGQLSRQASNRLLIASIGSRGLHLLCFCWIAREYTMPQFKRAVPQLPKRRRRWPWIVAIIATILIIAAFAGHGNAITTPPASDTPTTFAQVVQTTPTAHPTMHPTQKATSRPTTQPTHQATPRPTQPPQPTPTHPACGNPWCYDFSPGNLIYIPPNGFCNYFNCIASFYGFDDPGDGYIVQCVDGTFSQSGGERGACSSHGGESRPLYSH